VFTVNTIIGVLGQNLISNSDFETSGQLNCQSWFDMCGREFTYLCDTIIPDTICYSMFYQDAPLIGGNWSLGVIGVGNSPPSNANTYITGLNGTNIFELNIWMKDLSPAWGGVEISTISQGQYTLEESISADSADWTYYTVTDTLTLLPSDTIKITLWAIAAGPMTGIIYFDLVQFSIVDTSTFVQNSYENNNNLVNVYPNPSHGQITFETENKGYKTLNIYNSAGQIIKVIKTNKNKFIIDNRVLSKGQYFYKMTSTSDRTIIGQGKFLID